VRQDEDIARRDRPGERDRRARRRLAVGEGPHRIVHAAGAHDHRRTRAVEDFDRLAVARAFDVLGDEEVGGDGFGAIDPRAAHGGEHEHAEKSQRDETDTDDRA
jgi:hypothetical protein